MRLPEGVSAAGTSCGIKKRSPDLGLLAFDRPVGWAGTFTRNAAAAPCVIWSRARLGSAVRALVVNSGNANACTGAEGTKAVAETAEAAAELLGCGPSQILVSSTGPIGVPLPTDKITGALPDLVEGLSPDALPFARAILTTDSTTKVAVSSAGPATVLGIAKGAAMLAPNMATMLAFIVTDAAFDDAFLQEALQSSVDLSFNRLSVDACESTNDSVYLFSTDMHKTDPDEFTAALTNVAGDLAEQIVRDAEGGSKVIRIRVNGARDDDHAVSLGKAIAASALWRAAAHGGDPNWGRVLAAMGSVDRELATETLRVAIGDVTVFDAGEPRFALADAAAQMTGKEVLLTCDVAAGAGSAEVLSSDLSTDYVDLNAGGTT